VARSWKWGIFALAVIALGSCGGGSNDESAAPEPQVASSQALPDPLLQALAPEPVTPESPASYAAAKKASPKVLADLAAGKPRNLFVVFEDQAIQQEAENLQRQLGVPGSHKVVLDLRSRRMAEVKARALSTMTSTEVSELKHYSHLPIAFVRVRRKGALDKILANPDVAAVYEDGVVHRAMLAQSLPLIGQPQAAAAGDQGAGTAVVVLDQRVNYTLPAFGSCAAPGSSGCKVLVAQDVAGLPNDGLGYQDGHGTNVAATVLAVAPGTKILSLNVFSGESAMYSDVIAGINWAIANKATYNIVAVNMSLGGSYSTFATTASPYYSAFANARAAGILPVASAGNNGYTNALSLPAAVVGAVSVGAVYDTAYGYRSWVAPCTDVTTAADQVACFSNSASFLSVLAPGCEDDAGLSSGYFCGTSQASPHVAGAVAVLRAAFPNESISQTASRLATGLSVLDSKSGLTTHRLSLPAALALPSCNDTVSPSTVSVASSGAASSTIAVSAGSGCVWSATSTASWITILSGASGSGSGTVQYFVAANYGAVSRSASIDVAGKSVSVFQSGGAISPSGNSNVWLIGTDTYQTYGLNSVVLTAGDIYNASNSLTTGTLRLELWIANNPFILGGRGWRVATWQVTGATNGTLAPRQSFLNLTSPSLPLSNLPPPGSYFAQLLLTEFYGSTTTCAADFFCLASFADFNGHFFVPDVTAPSVPSGLTASPTASTKVQLAWAGSSDDVGVVAYKVFSGGNLLGRVASNGALVFNLQPATTYHFAVAACDAAENCSSQSLSASATTPAAVTPPADCVFNWAERTYPQFFAPAGAASATSAPYYYRYYPGTANYLAVSTIDNDVWVLGPLSANRVLNVGSLANFQTSAGCAH
jgi:subtilisin family serine protease